MSGFRKISRVNTSNVIFFECDIQERMRTMIKGFDSVLHNATRMTKMSKTFKIPLISTNQSPKIFGPTVKELTDLYAGADNVFTHSKTDFSMLEKPVLDQLATIKRDKVIIYGIECHVCVKQTCLDLLEKNYDVHLLVDGVSSMSLHDRTVAIEALRDAGVVLTTFQSLLFELAKNPGIPEYKQLLPLLKDGPKENLTLHHDLHKL